MRVWYRIFDNSGPEFLNTIHEAFQSVGIELCSPPEYPTGPGLAIFRECDHDLQDFLQSATRDRLLRIIAISLPRAVAHSAIWQLLRVGASDVLSWDNPEVTSNAVAARLARWKTIDDLIDSSVVQDMLVIESPAALSVMRELVEAAYFTNATILLMGESGTGKEVAARLIHSLDQRSNKGDLVTLDCTTVVPELSGSEFFGHERGAFTGAITARDGAFALANRGTLFLDEVGDLPLGLQGQLLRAIQEHSYKRVGGNTWSRTEFRLICATNRDLKHDVARGAFRSDLYYRIAGNVFTMPPLRNRPNDILPLARRFVRSLIPGPKSPDIDETVKEYLMLREYPGNVRDLKQLVISIMSHYVGFGPITAGCLPQSELPETATEHQNNDWCNQEFEHCIRHAILQGVRLKDIGRIAENIAVRIAVREERGSLKRAAARLRVTDRALQLRQAAGRLNNGQSQV